MEEKFEAILIEGPIGKELFKLTIPMIWGMLSMMIFNVVDTFFVARLGTIPLAAMGFIFPIVITVGHIALGLGIGASSVISRAIGEGDSNRVKRLTTDSIFLAFFIVGITLVIGYFTIDPLFTAMGASPETLQYIRPYMKIWYSGIIFFIVPMIGNHAIRASGDTFIPGMIMMSAALINIILDPLLIFGYLGFPKMGIGGAALATVISRVLVLVISFWVLIVKKKMLSFKNPQIKVVFESWKKVLHVGVPSAVSMMLPSMCIGILTWMVSDFGQRAVAGFGVAGKIEGLALVLFMALSTVFGPFIGQNWGAGKINRLRKAYTKVINFCLSWGTFQAVILFIFAPQIVSLFDRDPEVMRVAVMYLRIIPMSYGVVCVVFLSASAFNALGKPAPAIWLMVIRLVFLHIPLAFLGKKFFGLAGFLSVTYIAAIITGLLAFNWMRKTLKGQ